MLALAVTLGTWPARAEFGRQSDAPCDEPNLSAFDEVWETVRDRFYALQATATEGG